MAKTPTKTSRLRRKPDTFRRLTGISPDDFDQVLENLRPLYEKAERERLDRPDRERAIGTGRNFKLALQDRLLMLSGVLPPLHHTRILGLSLRH